MKRVYAIFFSFLLSTLGASLLPASASAEGSEAIHVDYLIICDDEAVSARLSALIDLHLKKDRELTRDEHAPRRKLFIYAQKDVNDRKNPDGWSFAIAHVSNVGNRILSTRLDDCQDPRCAEAKKLAVMMGKEEGVLKHLNVAHIDELTDVTLEQLTNTVVETFALKAKGQ